LRGRCHRGHYVVASLHECMKEDVDSLSMFMCCCAEGQDDSAQPQSIEALGEKDDPSMLLCCCRGNHDTVLNMSVDALEEHAELDEVDDSALHFKVRIQMPRHEYSGLLLDAPGGPYLRVTKIDAHSSAAEYNKSCISEDDRIRLGDFVIAVNGINTDCVHMCLELRAGGNLELTVSRPHEIEVLDLENDCTFGLDLSHQQGSSSLVIREVLTDGAIARWNESAGVEHKIFPNDHIVAVNGKTGTPKELMAEMRAAGTGKTSLLVTRPMAAKRASLWRTTLSK